jgi:hypothetical protein
MFISSLPAQTKGRAESGSVYQPFASILPRFLRILLLQSRLNLPRKSPEVCDALQFVVRQLDMKMMLQPGEQFESLETVNAERLEKVFVGIQFLPRHFEMGGRQVKNFVERLMGSGHKVRFLLFGIR